MLASARRGRALASVDLPSHECYCLLIHRRGVPRFDGRKVGFSRLVASAGPPAVSPQEIRRRIERIGGNVEIAGAVGEDVFRHELRLSDLSVNGPAHAGRENAALEWF